ncbi:hypothetical protein Gotur_000364 [Gossypium turneri]
METNSTTTSFIANDEQLEFLMDSHFSKILQGSGSVANNALKPGQAAAGCGRNPYDSCLSNPNRPITTEIAAITPVPAAGAMEVNGVAAVVLVQVGRFRAPCPLTCRGAARQAARVTKLPLFAHCHVTRMEQRL